MFKLICKTTIAIVVFALTIWHYSCASANKSGSSQDWLEEFGLENRTLSNTGESAYFILSPGFQITLESSKGKLIVTVLDETRDFNSISTRVVEEREEKNGELYEISRNFFAMDRETGDVFYFGEEVDFYKKGKIVKHTGAWLAYDKGNRPGLIMPGNPRIGMKYYQELAPGVAMDRAEVVNVNETMITPAGKFDNCLRTRESSKIKTLLFFSPKEQKTYAPGIGLIQDEKLVLTSYGYVNETSQ